MSDAPRFPGIQRPSYTSFPDEYIDSLMAELTGAEFKVLAYIVRHTFGWKKDSDAIAIRQMATGITRRDGSVVDRGTGLSTSTIQTALKGLVAKGVIVARKRKTIERGNETTTYAPRYADAGPYGENRHSPPPEIDTTLWRKSPQQETTQQTEGDMERVDPTRGMTDLERRRYYADQAR